MIRPRVRFVPSAPLVRFRQHESQPPQRSDHARQRQTHHGVEITLNRLNQRRGAPLDTVSAGLVQRLAGRDVFGNLIRVEWIEADACRLPLGYLLAARNGQRERGMDEVVPAREHPQHASRLLIVTWFTQRDAVDIDDGIGRERWKINALFARSQNRREFLARMVARQSGGSEVGERGFVVTARRDLNAEAERAQQVETPRRAACQEDAAQRRSAALR